MVASERPAATIKRSGGCCMPGVWRAVAHNPGAVAIFHSPRGCGHVARDLDVAAHYRSVARGEFLTGQETAPLLVSDLQEEHSIFGGAERLRQCIDYAMKEYTPQYIVIADSCVSGVIGDDLAAVARQAEADWRTPILAVPCQGFLDGGYHAGFYHTGRLLAERFMTARPRIKNTVTILSDRSGPCGANAEEIEHLLDHFGLKVHCYFPAHASLEDIRRVPSSDLSLALGGTSKANSCLRQLGTDLQTMFGIPFFPHDYPLGWQAAQNWLAALGDFLGRQECARMARQGQEEKLHRFLAEASGQVTGRSALLCLGRPLVRFDPRWALELGSLAGVSLAAVVLLDCLTEPQRAELRHELPGLTDAPLVDQADADNRLAMADVVFTTHELALDAKRQFILPLLPPIGVKGMTDLLGKLALLLRREGRWGRVVYG